VQAVDYYVRIIILYQNVTFSSISISSSKVMQLYGRDDFFVSLTLYSVHCMRIFEILRMSWWRVEGGDFGCVRAFNNVI
jgi:hypothetical protein